MIIARSVGAQRAWWLVVNALALHTPAHPHASGTAAWTVMAAAMQTGQWRTMQSSRTLWIHAGLAGVRMAM